MLVTGISCLENVGMKIGTLGWSTVLVSADFFQRLALIGHLVDLCAASISPVGCVSVWGLWWGCW
jgi:hypothetical protein